MPHPSYNTDRLSPHPEKQRICPLRAVNDCHPMAQCHVMDALADLIGWFNTDRASVLVALLALAGVIYSARAASSARKQSKSAERQVRHAKEQVELGRQQIDLLLRQIKQAEAVAAATEQARRETLQPNVVVDIAPGVNDSSVFVLTITNMGTSIARNVRVRPLDPMVRSDGTKLHEMTVFTEPITMMPPGHTRQFFYDVSFNPFSGKSPLRCRFEVDCDGPFGAVETAHFDIDLTPYEGGWAGPTTLYTVVSQMKKIVSSLDNVSKAIDEQRGRLVTLEGRPLVDATQLDDRARRWKAAGAPQQQERADKGSDAEASE
jgi:hypothetical protein